MFADRAKTPADFHNKKCFELIQRIARSIPDDGVLDSASSLSRTVIDSTDELKFIKSFRDKFKDARFFIDVNYSDFLRSFLFSIEVRLNKSPDFMNHPEVKNLINLIFEEHSLLPIDTLPTSELMLGSLAISHGKSGGVSPLFLAWIAYNAPPRPEVREQRKIMLGKSNPPVLLLYLNILATQKDNDPEFKRLVEGITEEYDYMQVMGITMPHDLMLKNSKEFKNGNRFSREELVALIVNVVCERDGDFYAQGGMAILQNPQSIEKMVRDGMQRLGVQDQPEFSKDEALAVYFHFVKYEMVLGLCERYQPKYLNFTTHDKPDRANIASAYHALVQSIEAGQPLTRAQFNAVLFAPEHESVRVRRDQMAILWKALHGYMRGLNARGIKAPEWLADWMEKHTPQHGRDWYLKQVNELINTRTQKAAVAQKVMKDTGERLLPADLKLLQDSELNDASDDVTFYKLKSILEEPERTKGILTADDIAVIQRVPELKAICDALKHDNVLDIESYQQTVSARKR